MHALYYAEISGERNNTFTLVKLSSQTLRKLIWRKTACLWFIIPVFNSDRAQRQGRQIFNSIRRQIFVSSSTGIFLGFTFNVLFGGIQLLFEQCFAMFNH